MIELVLIYGTIAAACAAGLTLGSLTIVVMLIEIMSE